MDTAHGKREEQLLQALGRLRRETQAERPLEARWAAHVHAAPEPGAEGGWTDDQAGLERALFDPLDAAASDRICAAVLAELSAQAAPEVEALRPTPPRGRRRWLLALPALAAACVAFMLLHPLGWAPADPLPAYSLEMGGGDSVFRGSEAPSSEAPSSEGLPALRLSHGSTLSVVLRPDRAVAGPVAARAYAVQDGVARPLSRPFQISEQGSFALRGPVDLLLGSDWRGPVELLLIIARPAKLPPAETSPAELTRGAAGRMLFRRRLEILDE